MTKRSKNGPVERWNRVVKEAEIEGPVTRGVAANAAAVPAGRDVQNVLAASDEEVLRLLREAGVDLEAEDARARETYEAVVAKHFPSDSGHEGAPKDDDPDDARGDVAWVAPTAGPEGTVTKLEDRRRSRRSTWLTVALVAAATVGGSVYVAAHHPPPAPPPPPPELPMPPTQDPPVTPTPLPVPAPVPAPVAPTPPPSDKAPRDAHP